MRSPLALAATVVFACAVATCQISKPALFPLQMETRVPFDPTAFPSAGQNILLYELHLTNFTPSPLSLDRIEVVDPNSPAQAIAVFDGASLQAMTGLLASGSPAMPPQIAGGQTAIVFMSVSFESESRIPDRLIHRVVASGATAEGAVIGTRHTQLQVLGPPVEAANWIADDGPGNEPDNHHRRGIHVFDGQPVISERYAIDWEQVQNGASFSGDPKDRNSYFAYGKPVLAVADARVIRVQDELPENTPGHGDAFHPAAPITLDTLGGNMVVLDIGQGEYAYYLHLQPGSVRVKIGDRVRRGQVLARIGASGDAREPHLHFEVTTSPKPFFGEGIPYLIDQYTITPPGGGSPQMHKHELPLNKSIISFRISTSQ